MSWVDPRRRAKLLAHRGARIGLLLVGVVVVFALVGPLFAGDPLHSDFARGATEDGLPVGPSAVHWLGTDRLFRDVFARLAVGARTSLMVGFAATVIATVLGTGVGVVAGWYEGTEGTRIPWASVLALGAALVSLLAGSPRLALVLVVAAGALVFALARLGRGHPLARGLDLDADTALMRLVDVGLSFPFLLLVLALGAALERTTASTIMITLGLTGWLGTARVVRAKTLQVRNLDFVLAARALGRPTTEILFVHVVPSVLGPILVLSTAAVAQMILAESALGYLGAGIAPPAPTWGHMLYEGQDNFAIAPWLVAAPGVAILLTVFGFNLLGEGLRDAFDPRD
jgi:ABC-type dipeptide/oligopeptide/nickel transport system permease subunit